MKKKIFFIVKQEKLYRKGIYTAEICINYIFYYRILSLKKIIIKNIFFYKV